MNNLTKKLSYLLAPLAVIPLLFSCNKVDTKVTEEEYNDAIAFKDVQYLQTNMSDVSSSGTNINDLAKLAPNVFYEKIQGAFEIYSTASEDRLNVTYIERANEESPFSEPVTVSMEKAKDDEYYADPIDMSLKKSYLKDVSFDKFNYAKGVYTYDYLTDDGDIYSWQLSFNNKKIAKFNLYAKTEQNEENIEMTFTYNKIVPKDPSK